jgi:predicted transcriptional regulator
MGKREAQIVAALAEVRRARDAASVDPLPAAVLAARDAGATLEEIGSVLGITRQSVHGYITRIREKGAA